MDIEKVKRIFPDLIEKVKQKVKKPSNVDVIEEQEVPMPETNYKFLPNDGLYKSMHKFEKLWYLRGRFDYFHLLASKNSVAADKQVEMLSEICEELANLAFHQSNMDDVLAICNLKFNVEQYYKQFTLGMFLGRDCFNYSVEHCDDLMQMNIYDEIWILRSMFDEAMETNSAIVVKNVKMWMKSLIAKCSGKNELAMKNIYERFKQQSKTKFCGHYDIDNTI